MHISRQYILIRKKIIAINAGALKKAGSVLLLFALNFFFALSSFADIKTGSSNVCLNLFQTDKPKPKNVVELGLAVTNGLYGFILR